MNGKVDDFKVENEPWNMTLKLEEASITDTEGGRFTGGTSADGGFTGKWGG